ncbi:MAG: cellulase family glycosylhydrolase [Nitrolancea sp.]
MIRRISFFFVALVLLGALAACGGGSSKNTTTTSTDSTAEPTAAGSPAVTRQQTATSTEAASPAETTTANSTASAETTATGTASSTASGNFGYGFNVYARGDENGADFNSKTIDAVKGAGFNWVRIQVQWKSLEPAKNQYDPLPLDRVVQQYQDSGVSILASVVKAPDWALDPTGNQLLANYSDWEGFMHFLAERYKGKIAAYEIWNEENLASEMGGTVRIEDYAHLLQGGYAGAKMADSNAVIVFGGLTPTGVNDPSIAIDDQKYLQQFYQYQNGAFTKYFDVLGMHVSATNNPPDTMYPDNPGPDGWSDDPSFYFRRAEQLHQVQVQNGDHRPVWITEFGWSTKNEAKGYEYGADITPQDQADYLVGAFDWAKKNWPWTTAMFVWNLNYAVVSDPADEKYPWAVVNSDWSPRPAYTALKDMPKS